MGQTLGEPLRPVDSVSEKEYFVLVASPLSSVTGSETRGVYHVRLTPLRSSGDVSSDGRVGPGVSRRDRRGRRGVSEEDGHEVGVVDREEGVVRVTGRLRGLTGP